MCLYAGSVRAVRVCVWSVYVSVSVYMSVSVCFCVCVAFIAHDSLNWAVLTAVLERHALESGDHEIRLVAALLHQAT